MRHRKKFNHLGRTTPHRKAMLANMASSLILHKRITTTTAKAKELRTFVEPIITRSKEDSTHSRRMVFRNLRDKYAVSELFREVATKVGERPGGYTRIIKLGYRQGDNADMCIIELVDYNENLLAEKTDTKSKSTRRRRGGKKKETGEDTGAAISVEAAVTTESVADETAVETEVRAEPVAEVTSESVSDTAAAETEFTAETETETEEETIVEEETVAEAKVPAEPEAVVEEVETIEETAELKAEETEETEEAGPEEDKDKEEKKEE
jgi:large subunit ribosomal protein L17